MRISDWSSDVCSSDLYATALRELYRGGGSRSNAAGGGMRAAAGNVALAVEAALVLGVVDHPGVIDGHGIDVTRLRWLHSDHPDVATAIDHAGEEIGRAHD